jgi:hypothetical protein
LAGAALSAPTIEVRKQGGAPLARSRLVVIGEVTGGRDVHDVVELDVEPAG